MIHRVGTSTNRILFGLTSCVVVLTYIAYKISETKVSEKSNKDGNKNVSSDVMKNLKPTNGPMFNYSDETLTKTVLDMASQRAKRWMSFRSTGVQYMVGQVGGKSANKRPILIFESYVLKPANADHRGIREVAFYEAIQATHGRNKRNGYEMYCTLFGPNHEIRDESTSFLSLLSGQKNLSCFTKKKHQATAGC